MVWALALSAVPYSFSDSSWQTSSVPLGPSWQASRVAISAQVALSAEDPKSQSYWRHLSLLPVSCLQVALARVLKKPLGKSFLGSSGDGEERCRQPEEKVELELEGSSEVIWVQLLIIGNVVIFLFHS